MNKLKSLIKRLVGRPASSLTPVTVDICSKTADGYVVIGWYLSEQVNGLSVVDNASSALDFELTDIERQDVIAQIGKPASGFQLLCQTELALSEIKLAIKLSNGESQQIPLALNNADQFVSPIVSEFDDSPGISARDMQERAACEFAIVTPTHVFLSGWLAEGGDSLEGELKNRKGKHLGQISHQLRYGRQDVQEVLGLDVKWSSGFLMLIERDASQSFKDRELRLSITAVGGEEHNLTVHEVFHADKEPMANLKRLLNSWNPHNAQHLAEHAMFKPILEALYPADKFADARRVDVGGKIERPLATAIIPLYGRYDFMRYQLSHFDRYPEYDDLEILYVVDDPRIASHVAKLARLLNHSIQHPFSILYLSENVGFGKANNIGVKHATADNLVLMNSDVLPKNGSWLADMLDVAQQQQAGIVGARLLYEDDTIQHDGMAPMTLPEYPGLFFNDHPKKGWPKNLAKVDKPVSKTELLTAACWVMKKSTFEQVSGFDPAYVLGDFEDSDLCFKVLSIGLTNYMHHASELYHLERQSQNLVESGRWKHNLTILNAVTFNHKWKKQISKLNESGASAHE